MRNPETRKKLSQAKMGVPNPKIRGENNGSKQLEARRKISLAAKGRPHPELGNRMRGRKGVLHPCWKGLVPLNAMIRTTPKYKEWRKAVFERDGFKCQECGKNGTLEAHHIKPFIHLLSEFLRDFSPFSPQEDKMILSMLAQRYHGFWDTRNGKTLCIPCHKKTRETAPRSLTFA